MEKSILRVREVQAVQNHFTINFVLLKNSEDNLCNFYKKRFSFCALNIKLTHHSINAELSGLLRKESA
jgi:hypothetical protein